MSEATINITRIVPTVTVTDETVSVTVAVTTISPTVTVNNGLSASQVQTLIDADIGSVEERLDSLESLTVETFSADYQLQATDSNKLKRCTSAVDVNLTIPADLTLPLPVAIEQAGNGVVTIVAVAGAGVTVNGDPKTAGQYKYIVIVKVAANVYSIIGGTS